MELTLSYLTNSNACFFRQKPGLQSDPHPTLTLCAKTFAGQYANKRRGAIEDGGLFIIANYWRFLPKSRFNDYIEQHNGPRRYICIGTW